VDDLVREAHAAVEAAGALGSTYFIFTSDHGLHMGQRRLGAGKRTPYETDLRVPFYIAG
jgi:arylsulfatase A-like enzyme